MKWFWPNFKNRGWLKPVLQNSPILCKMSTLENYEMPQFGVLFLTFDQLVKKKKKKHPWSLSDPKTFI
jgi:hypothetical protein